MEGEAGRGSRRAGQSVFNWLCRLEGQRSRAQHAAVTLHYSHRPHNERPHNQLPTDPSFKPHAHTPRTAPQEAIKHIPCPRVACSSMPAVHSHTPMHTHTHTLVEIFGHPGFLK